MLYIYIHLHLPRWIHPMQVINGKYTSPMDSMGLDPVAWISRQLCRLSQPKEAFSSVGPAVPEVWGVLGACGICRNVICTWNRMNIYFLKKNEIFNSTSSKHRKQNQQHVLVSIVGINCELECKCRVNHYKLHVSTKRTKWAEFASQTTSDIDNWILFLNICVFKAFFCWNNF